MCGKNPLLEEAGFEYEGSPPRVREKHLGQFSLTAYHGITPACAGKTLKDPIEIANTD